MSIRKTLKLLKSYYSLLKKENLFKILLITCAVVFLGGTAVYFIEKSFAPDPGAVNIKSIFDAIWWGFVTIFTVGYGDRFPVSAAGRVVAVMLMIVGVSFISVLTATISSIFVEKRIKEGRGLEQVNLNNHFVICGWNDNIDRILENIKLNTEGDAGIVLLCNIAEEKINELKYRHEELRISFVRGEATQETVLKRANIQLARGIILLADTTLEGGDKAADDRTLIAALAIKNLAPDVILCAEIKNKDNELHMRRAKVDEIIYDGEFSGFLMANAVIQPGYISAFRELMTMSMGNDIMKIPIPEGFRGKAFQELSEHFRKKFSAILIGVISEDKKMTLDDILSDDSSAIDLFIKRKFQEAGDDYFGGEKRRIKVNVNPPDGYVIKDTDSALVIAKRENIT